MDQKWVFIIVLISGVCVVSAHVPHRYHFVNENKTWTEAQSYCRQAYSDLAIIKDMAQMKDLNATLNKHQNQTPSSSVWIGLSKGGPRKWLWSLAGGEAYQNWASGEPNNVGGIESCAVMKKSDGTWLDDVCDNLYTFVCYDEKKTNNGNYIVLISVSKTWLDAQSYCREHYTDMASVRNQSENQQIWNFGKTLGNNLGGPWIGLSNDYWQWSDQSNSLFRYWASIRSGWHQGGNNNCTAVSMTDQGRWYDMNCGTKLPFICLENKLILIKQKLTWREALRYCRENHVDLVSVHPEEIQLWVEEVVQEASTELVWLGLRHTCTQGFWFWVSGFSICYQNWAPGTGGEDCSSVERTGAVQSRGGQWVSLPETQRLNFICTTYID